MKSLNENHIENREEENRDKSSQENDNAPH
jgi:hypothetical protein